MNRKKSSQHGCLTADGIRVVRFLTSDQKALIRNYLRNDSANLQALVELAYDLSDWGYL
jgi:hypothetical protein